MSRILLSRRAVPAWTAISEEAEPTIPEDLREWDLEFERQCGFLPEGSPLIAERKIVIQSQQRYSIGSLHGFAGEMQNVYANHRANMQRALQNTTQELYDKR